MITASVRVYDVDARAVAFGHIVVRDPPTTRRPGRSLRVTLPVGDKEAQPAALGADHPDAVLREGDAIVVRRPGWPVDAVGQLRVGVDPGRVELTQPASVRVHH